MDVHIAASPKQHPLHSSSGVLRKDGSARASSLVAHACIAAQGDSCAHDLSLCTCRPG